ncbi:hypothetical protein Dda_4726 [Drechslerella dactyloides]|uniref:Tse2 ADP-ribosyltransferase toxin domain-containing protein n=1 Tax=Drechslerella dactyloides TaxID=74499 RepID=A0AAD6NJM4_DREDA|nr:hypothetical protein Dda_4726 [Drechslerella dactyloides]
MRKWKSSNAARLQPHHHDTVMTVRMLSPAIRSLGLLRTGVPCYSTRANRPLLGRFRSLPIELFRVNNGLDVRLRDRAAQLKFGRRSFDLIVRDDGLVHPMLGDTFEGPNGASMRPNSPYLSEIVANFAEEDAVIYRVAQGTPLPDELVVLHEHTEHYSVQCSRPMPLPDLNRRVTEFFKEKGEMMGVFEFEERYPYMPKRP